MSIPVWVDGQVLAAADVNAWFVPVPAYKTLDQSVTSSTALVNDLELTVALGTMCIYRFNCSLSYEGGTQGSSDLKWKWTFPSGVTMRYHRIGIDTAGASTAGFLSTETATPLAGTAGAGVVKAVTMIGTIVTFTSVGNLQLQWAQNSSSATSTIVHAGSSIDLQRIG